MKRKKICLLGKFPPYIGGISTHNYYLAKTIEEKHDLLKIGYRKFYPNIIGKETIDNNYDLSKENSFFKSIHRLLTPYNPRSWKNAVNLIKYYNPDIVIIPWWYEYLSIFYIYIESKLNNFEINFVILCHNVFLHSKFKGINKIVLNNFGISKFLVKRVFSLAENFIVPSSQERKQILSFHKSPNIIKNLHPLYNFNLNKNNYKNKKSFNLLFFGYIRENKGLHVLLKALSIIKSRNVELTIAGKVKSKEDKLRYLSITRNNNISDIVTFIDEYIPQNEINVYFNKADLVVLPYIEGTSSGVLSTAYGFGKPVLVTNVGGIPEAVLNKKTGLIVDKGSPRKLAGGITWFIKNKDINFKNNIEKFVKENMTWKTLLNKIEKFI